MKDFINLIEQNPPTTTLMALCLIVMCYTFVSYLKYTSKTKGLKRFMIFIFIAAFSILGYCLYNLLSNPLTQKEVQTISCYDEEIIAYKDDLAILFQEVIRERGKDSHLVYELMTMNKFRDFQTWTCEDKRTALIEAKSSLKDILRVNNFYPSHNLKILQNET